MKMSVNIDVTYTGWDETTTNLQLLAAALESDFSKEELTRIGNRVLEIAQSLAPVKTGALKGSLKLIVNDDSVVIGSDLDYSVYVELGTSKMQARPYLMPALFQALNEFQQEFPNRIKEFLK